MSKRFFFEKKKQKAFVAAVAEGWTIGLTMTHLQRATFFGFLKKTCFLFFLKVFRMKSFLLLAFVLSPTLAVAQTTRSGSETGSDAKSRCIHDPDIVRTERPDDQTILFYMRDHTVWKNTLQFSCIGLKNEPDGFTYQPTDPGEELLCSNQVTIRLNSFHSFCQLGDFTRVQLPPEPNPAGRVVR